MIKLMLNGQWELKRVDNGEAVLATVPGSVFEDLLKSGKLEDPFYRDNEDEFTKAAAYDYEYERSFEISKELMEAKQLTICCEGLDTLAEIRINDKLIAATNNMHRTYQLDIKDFVKLGENKINILFKSPSKYIKKKNEQTVLWGPEDSMAGFPHIRKAHYMFGWDWGPWIPDFGIWRDIYIKGYEIAKIEDVYISQKHEEDKVLLNVKLVHQKLGEGELQAKTRVTSPKGEVIEKTQLLNETCSNIEISIVNPQLWWPNGLGEQHLYKVEVMLFCGEQQLDEKVLNIGLRTMTVRKEKDQWGENFEFNVNGISIFAMGANYIPEDNLLGRCSKEKTERLIKDCVRANFNCIRVWGGGIYPEDYFFDLCDKYGLVVWQDLMFACAVYELTDEFADTIENEARDNIKRIRHHASLGLWCGNNEIESAWENWHLPATPKQKTDYVKQFEVLLPKVVKETDPNTFFWPSSPSSGGDFDNTGDQSRGDVHYWAVWHGLKPFADYRNVTPRFMSEFGFESFPSMKTVKAFALPEDMNAFSYVMEKHQKCKSANGKILHYLSQTFKYPKDFDALIYASQLLQAEAMKYGVEYWRQNRGRCMGAIYWQLNDCWPVASWASVDYYGRWKALHYFAKRFYAPVLVSAREEGTSVKLFVTNDSVHAVEGKVQWKLRNGNSEVLREGSVDVEIGSLTAVEVADLEFGDIVTDKALRETYMEYSFIKGAEIISSGTVLFVPVKHFELQNPRLEYTISETEKEFVIDLNVNAFAKYVELDMEKLDGIFSDNYFDMIPKVSKKVVLDKTNISKEITLEVIRKEIKVRTLYDTFA